ncbi:hypothetical protein ACO0QE_004760 [Hanseniaspora vineae]
MNSKKWLPFSFTKTSDNEANIANKEVSESTYDQETDESNNANTTGTLKYHTILGIQQPFYSPTLIKDIPGTYPMLIDDDKSKTESNTTSENDDETLDEPVKTKSGIILNPQPTKDKNDPLNWPIWRRDLALIVVGIHCFVGGGQTAVLAAGTTKITQEFNVPLTKVSYLVGLMMVALALGSLIASPTARIVGKRVTYLGGIVVFFFGSIGCACSKTYPALLISRIVSGFGVSTIESLPSATIAEIYYAHERAYRFGIYTLLLLGGKNLVPLFGSLVFQNLNIHWLFWIITIIVGIDFVLHVFFVPETFWNRAPVPNKRSLKESQFAREQGYKPPVGDYDDDEELSQEQQAQFLENMKLRVHFVSPTKKKTRIDNGNEIVLDTKNHLEGSSAKDETAQDDNAQDDTAVTIHSFGADYEAHNETPQQLFHKDHEKKDINSEEDVESSLEHNDTQSTFVTKSRRGSTATSVLTSGLSLYNGRHSKDKWKYIFVRPFVLFCYPHVLFSSFLYCFSIVWLIVIAQLVAHIFMDKVYKFSSLETGLIYISPFVGGCLGSLCAGTVSDYVVRYMSKRNHGFYEPEFRLLMCIPAVLATAIGMFAFGWSAQLHDMWFVPTFFFGLLAFGCSLASTTAITLTVDSYKNYAQESLVTFNVCKNIMGFIFSFFNTDFAQSSGTKTTFIVYGCVELALGLCAIPLYIYGKRIREWTQRANLMEFTYKQISQEKN